MSTACPTSVRSSCPLLLLPSPSAPPGPPAFLLTWQLVSSLRPEPGGGLISRQTSGNHALSAAVLAVARAAGCRQPRVSSTAESRVSAWARTDLVGSRSLGTGGRRSGDSVVLIDIRV